MVAACWSSSVTVSSEILFSFSRLLFIITELHDGLFYLLYTPAQLVGAAQPPAHTHGSELSPGRLSLLQGGQHVQELLLSFRVEGPGILTG